jgi:hypothetical protein
VTSKAIALTVRLGRIRVNRLQAMSDSRTPRCQRALVPIMKPTRTNKATETMTAIHSHSIGQCMNDASTPGVPVVADS